MATQIMVGGLVDGVTRIDDSIVEFRVRNADRSNEFIYVRADIPPAAQQLIELESPIWWHSDWIYVELCDVPDNKFKKVGYSYGWHFI